MCLPKQHVVAGLGSGTRRVIFLGEDLPVPLTGTGYLLISVLQSKEMGFRLLGQVNSHLLGKALLL